MPRETSLRSGVSEGRKAGEEAGYHVCKDHNGQRQEGSHSAQSFTHDGRRAGGVEIENRVQPIDADREVILAGGAINAPQLLLLSGIGDPGHLAVHGIPLVADVPSVGRHLDNHMIVEISYGEKTPLSVSHRLQGLKRYTLGLEWLLLKSSVGTSILTETGCFFASPDEADYCDLQHEFHAMTVYMGAAEANVAPGLMFSMGIMRPESRGRVSLKSADPCAHPSILFNYLDAEKDRQTMIDRLKRTREMVSQPAFDS